MAAKKALVCWLVMDVCPECTGDGNCIWAADCRELARFRKKKAGGVLTVVEVE